MVAVLFRNPAIHTFDGSGAPATAVLSVDGTIAAVGEYARLRELAPAGTRTEDLPGQAVVAGFHDAHIHSGTFARELDALDLRGTTTLENALDRVRAYVDDHPGDGWVLGGRWDSNTWADPVQPNRRDLDGVVPDRPVALPSIDGHTVWMNSVALRLVGITATTPDPPGGEIVRDAAGEPTGILRESAGELPPDVVIAVDGADDLAALLERGQQRLLSYGLTHITDFDGEEVRDAYLTMQDRGALALRVHKGIPMAALDKAIADERRTGEGDRWFTTGPVKLFSDGALGSHTAHMGEAFAGQAGNRGIEVVPYDDLHALIEKAAASRIAVATHAIGDEANHLVLNAYEAARDTTRRHGLRHRVEHAQHVRGNDVARFAELGVIASSQPTHCTTDFRLAEKLLAGRELANYPWRAFVDAGAHLAFGSDSPVEPADPMYGVHAAVTRQNRDGDPDGGWEPHQRVSVSEALAAYTAGGAYAAGLDDRVGRLAPGQYADLVALDRDPLTEPAGELHRITVLSTVVDGEVRYTR